MAFCIATLITAQTVTRVPVGQGGTRPTRKKARKPETKREKRPETRHRTTQGDRLDTLLVAGNGVPLAIRTARKPVTPDNLLTNSATVSDESTQESCHKKSEKPLVLAILGSLPSAGLRKVEYGRTAGNLTICRQILPQSAMSPHKSYHNKRQEPLALACGPPDATRPTKKRLENRKPAATRGKQARKPDTGRHQTTQEKARKPETSGKLD